MRQYGGGKGRKGAVITSLSVGGNLVTTRRCIFDRRTMFVIDSSGVLSTKVKNFC